MGTRAELPATFEETLSALLRTRSDERRWALINHATTWPEQAGDEAFRLLQSRGTIQRQRGAEILGFLCDYQPQRIPEFTQALVRAFDRERDEDPLLFIFFALSKAVGREGEVPPRLENGEWKGVGMGKPDRPERSHVWDLLGADRLRRAASLKDSADPDHRKELAIAISDFVGMDRIALETLIELSRDADTEPRDWATFELAVSLALLEKPDASDPDVLAALMARLDDPQCEIRNQAAYGLALRHDPRAFEVVDRQLRDPHEAWDWILDAAEELADPRLLPALDALAAWWPKEDAGWLEAAFAACRGEALAD
jgi:hypothetical protein